MADPDGSPEGAPGAGERVGVLGGTFDPPHVGHAIVAQDVLEALALDRLLVVPAARPPHRDAVFPAERRLEWVRRVFAGAPGLEVSDVELRRDGPSYTVDTLARLREDLAPAELFLVIGADQLRLIGSWHRHERISRLARLVVMDRDGGGDVGSEEVTVDRVVDVTRIELSSTRVRERLRDGRSVRFLVPEAIRADVEAAWAARGGASPAPARPGGSGSPPQRGNVPGRSGYM